MTNSMDDIVNDSQIIFAIGTNTTEQHPVLGMRLRREVKERGLPIIVADPRDIPLTDFAVLHLRHEPGTDIALLNGLMHVLIAEGLYDEEYVAQRCEGFEDLKAAVDPYTPEKASGITGVPAEDIVKAARMLAAHRPGALLYAMGITQHTCGHQNVLSCANLQMLLGNMGVAGGGVNPLRGQNNVQGACDMGGLVNVYPGYQKVVAPESHAKFEQAWGRTSDMKAGLTVTQMMDAAGEGKLRALYIMGENPMLSDPDINHVRQCLEKCEFLVIQDIFLTESAALADVVLPAVAFAEKAGTVTNTERRVQLMRPVVKPPGEARQDWEIISQVAQAVLGDEALEGPHADWDYSSPAEVADEIAALTPIYGGIVHRRLEPVGLQWPCPTMDHPGTVYLHKGKFSRGLGHMSGVEHTPPAEVPDEEYPLLLTTGRTLSHYHTGTMTRRSVGLDALVPEGMVEIHPQDAARLGINDLDVVRVMSRRGEVTVKADVTEAIRPGVVFMTFHFAEAAANVLTNPALDPTAKIPEYKACAVRIEPVK